MQRQMQSERMVLTVILMVGVGLRFYNLGVPSMWWDEALVPLICRFPAMSILEWLRTIEVHPPLYYLLTKAVMAVDASDSSLRLLAAVPGISCTVSARSRWAFRQRFWLPRFWQPTRIICGFRASCGPTVCFCACCW